MRASARRPRRMRGRRRRADEGGLLAGLREPGIHARAPRIDGEGRAAAGHRTGRARPGVLYRGGRDRGAQPGARGHAERADVRARAAGAGRGADDEHLLDLPGSAERVPGTAGRERGVPLADQRDAGRRGALLREGTDEQELPLAAGGGAGAGRAAFARAAAAYEPAGGPVLRLLHRAPAPAPGD